MIGEGGEVDVVFAGVGGDLFVVEGEGALVLD